MTLSNGAEYIGEFKEDRQEGFGMLATKLERLIGEWIENQIVEGFLVDKKIYFG